MSGPARRRRYRSPRSPEPEGAEVVRGHAHKASGRVPGGGRRSRGRRRWGRRHGGLPDDAGEVREIGRSKAKTIASLIHDTLEDEKRIVVFGTFTRELAALEEEIADKRTTVLRIDGSTKPEDRLAMRQRFGSDDPARLVIVAQIKTLSVAVNELVTARNAIFASLPWQRDDIVQARDRLNRLGQKSATTFWYALAPNTVDDLVFQAYQDRTDLEKTLMNHIYADRK